MAPVAPLGRARAIKLVEQDNLPFTFGSPHPHVAVVEQDGVFRIRQLVVDEAEAHASHDEAVRNDASWMPEHYYGLGRPTGEIYVEAKTRDELLDRMKTMEWPDDW